MAIKSLKITNRLKTLATEASTSEVAMAEFRSLEEIKEFLKYLADDYLGFEKRVNALKDFFLKYSAKNRINKILSPKSHVGYKPPQKKQTAAGDNDSFGFDSEVFERQRQKYGDQHIDEQIIKVIDPSVGGEVQKIPVKIAPHDYQTLRKHFMGVEEWQEKLESLDIIEAHLTTKFKGTPGSGALLKLVNGLRSNIQKSVNRAYSFLNKVAKNIAPVAFTNIVEEVIERLEKDFEGKYFEDMENTIYLTAEERPVKVMKKVKGKDKEVTEIRYDLKFVFYVQLNELQDESGMIAEKAFLIYVAKVDMERMMMTLFATYADRFIPPMKVKAQRRVFHDVNSCWRQTLAIVATEFGIKEINKTPWPSDSKKIKETVTKSNSGKYVKDAGLDENDDLLVTFNKQVTNEAQAEKVAKDLQTELFMLIQAETGQKVTVRRQITQPQADAWGAIYDLSLPVGYVRDEKVERKLFDRFQRLGIPLTEKEFREFVRMKNF